MQEFRKEVAKALKPLNARLDGVLFTINDEQFSSASRGVDIHSLVQAMGSARQKTLDRVFLLSLEGAGGRLTAAISFENSAHFHPEDISSLLEFLMRNFMLKEERDRDSLTGFLKKDAFRERMLKIALKVKKEAESKKTARQRKGRSPSLSFFHLDLDHFKGINDTLGHRFGDEVLKSFSRQTREFLASKDLDEMLFARLGGEEFGVLIPYLSGADAFKLAEELCSFIRDSDIPSSSEIAKYKKSNPEFKPLSLPRVTASIGIATADSAVILRVPDESLAGELDQLYERADVATYVAKKLGRNRAMAFGRILAEGGTIIDFDERTGIATLDLGSDMGVDVGDVFRVYDNFKFTGKQPIIQPGSQNKIIGHYPKLVLGELEVIMSQSQVSFAMLRSGDSFVPAAGFFLEWVPPSQRSKRTSPERRRKDRRKERSHSSRSLFEAKLRESQDSQRFLLALLALDNMLTIKEQRGSTAVKELYRSFANELERNAIPGDVVSAIGSDYIAFIPSGTNPKEVVAKLTEIKRLFAQRDKATFSAVIFDSETASFDRTRALDITRKGIEAARFKGVDQMLLLTPSILLTKLYFYHEQGEYDKVVAEYQQLREIGITDKKALLYYSEALSYLGRLEEAVNVAHDILTIDKKNTAALEVLASAAFEMEHYQEAASAYETLAEIKKKDIAPWQWRDFGIALLYLGQTRQALDNLDMALAGDATDAMAIYQKGETLLALGEKEKARKEFLKAFELGYRELSPQAAKLLGEG